MKVLKKGDTYKIVKEDVSIKKSLPAQKYVVTESDIGELVLKGIKSRKLDANEFFDPYDYYISFADSLLVSFNNEQSSLGVIVDGDRGNGKTCLSQLISTLAIQRDMPVIIVNKFHPEIVSMIDSIKQNIILILEDYHETYALGAKGGFKSGTDQRKTIKYLLEGNNQYKRMIIVNCNKRYINNRDIINDEKSFPYRCSLDYPSLFEIELYLKRTLKKDYYHEIENVIRFSFTKNISFSLLASIAFELNKGFTFTMVQEYLNLSSEASSPVLYDVDYDGQHTTTLINFEKSMDNICLNTDDKDSKRYFRILCDSIVYPKEYPEYIYDYAVRVLVLDNNGNLSMVNIRKKEGLTYLDHYKNSRIH